jgi:acyl carrier protein
MALVVAIEGAFGIMLDTDDILGLSSVGRARDILVRYGVTFDAA